MVIRIKYLLTEKQIKNILNAGLEYGVNEGWDWDNFEKEILKKYSRYRIIPRKELIQKSLKNIIGRLSESSKGAKDE